MNYKKTICGAFVASAAIIMPFVVLAHDEQKRQLEITISALQTQISSLQSQTSSPPPIICNDGNQYEITSPNSIYETSKVVWFV